MPAIDIAELISEFIRVWSIDEEVFMYHSLLYTSITLLIGLERKRVISLTCVCYASSACNKINCSDSAINNDKAILYIRRNISTEDDYVVSSV